MHAHPRGDRSPAPCVALAAPAAGPSAEPQRPLARHRILVVEDTPDVRRLLEFILRAAGAEVVLAENGAEALSAALPAAGQSGGQPAPPHFDAVLMDMHMPVLDGYTATSRLRKAGYSRPIIALTAHVVCGDPQWWLAAGCDAYVPKPFARAKLLATIAHYAAQARDDRPHPPPPA